MLDLSAASDTVDHDRLIYRLSSRLNITDIGLEWVRSYLSNRKKNRGCITGESSATTKMIFGMPQDPVVGPWMLTNYVLPIGDIIKHYGLSYHLYADDSQIYTTFNPMIPGDEEVCLFKIETCVRKIKRWMTYNKLKLSDEKTEFYIAAHQQDQCCLCSLTLQLDGDNKFSASSNIRNLGVVFDSNMQMSDQVSTICRTANFQLSNLWRIRRFTDKDTCAHAVRAPIISRLDYCNSLLHGISKYDINRLQRLQNRAAKLVFALGRREHVTPLLKDLQWLHMEERIKVKVLPHIYKCLHGQIGPILPERSHGSLHTRTCWSSVEPWHRKAGYTKACASSDRGQILLQGWSSPMEPHPGSNQISPIHWGIQEAVKNPPVCWIVSGLTACFCILPLVVSVYAVTLFHLLLVLVFHSSLLPRFVIFLVEAQ